jgi:hypothetical protein
MTSQLYAQTTVVPQPAPCGIGNLTPEQARSLVQQAKLALERKRASGAAFSQITYVPIRPHIIRRSDGTGGFTLANLNQAIAATNSYYLLNGFGIQFYFAGTTPDYIDDDNLFFGFSSESAIEGRDATNALNQYYVAQFSGPYSGYGGYAKYPYDHVASTRSFILTGPSESIEDLGNRLIPHELGHTFNLIHTFGQNVGNGTLGSGITTELVTRGNGANCSTDGDLICDTPADPFNMVGTKLYYPDGCVHYDPSSTARDANGEAFSPSMTNIMSYYLPCTHDFTPGQYDRIQEALALRQSHTSYTLNAPPTGMIAPSGLTANLNGLSVVLTWQDNADNEIGYFIERSTSQTTGFVSIGGVGPSTTTFTDTKASPKTHYYYRVRPSNTTTGSISSTTEVNTPSVGAIVTGTVALLSWPSSGNGATYAVQWRAVGAADWTTISGITTNSVYLYYLTSNTTYEWRFTLTGTDTYEGPFTFTVPCQTPTNQMALPAHVSASLSWSGPSTGQTYTVRWRAIGASDWITVNDLTDTTYTLTGLRSGTAYEWQIQSVCSPTAKSDFSPSQSFSTFSCQTPFALTSYNVYSSSANVNWQVNYSDTELKTELRYRPVGTTNWTVITGLASTTYSLTGLTNDTQYEWQVRSVCSPTEQSDFSSSSLFTTNCSIPISLNAVPTATQASLAWYVTNGGYEPGTTFSLQYRITGSSDWTTLSGLTSTNYSLTGLAANTAYEWRVKHVCSAVDQTDYVAAVTFSTRCNAPTEYSIYVSLITSSSAKFFWYVENEVGTTYEIRYRPVNTSNWSSATNLTSGTGSGSYNLTGLVNNTTYEWQIRATCSASDNSAYVSGPNFTTQCQIPDGLSGFNALTVSSAVLTWSPKGEGVQYDLRYRRVGNSDWTMVENLSTNNASLTGLSGGIQYEWQVKTHCSDGQYSDYSSVSRFTTPPCSPANVMTTSSITDISATLDMYVYGANKNTRTEVRWRVVGDPNWTTASTVTSTNSINYSYLILDGLTGSTQYEWQSRMICSPTETSDYSVSVTFQTNPPCTSMYTLKTGSWNDVSVWSCGRLPASIDDVTIQAEHKVLLDSTMAEALCHNLEILGTFSMQGSSININGERIVVDQENVTSK